MTKPTVFTIFCIQLFYGLVTAVELDSRCSAKFCEQYIDSGKCRTISATCRNNPNSTRFPYPDTCNCCDICIKHLGEGDSCVMGSPGTSFPLEMCGPDLQCRRDTFDEVATCKTIISHCTNAQELFEKRRLAGLVGMTEVRPECDGDGFFKPYHCIPGSLCYCVAPNGERIFGEMPHLHYEDEKKMTCGCSINAWRAAGTLDPQFGKLDVARCTETGGYDQLQCMLGSNSTCLCVHPEAGSPITEIDTVLEMDTDENRPPCFDKSRHSAGRYATECEAAFENYLTYLTAKRSGDADLREIVEPLCQPDGKFAKVQNSAGYNKKICAYPDGRQIDAYEAESDAPEAKVMTCNCARARWLLRSADVVELPRCCPNGNFEAWQCRRNDCFCVDDNGDQLGMEARVGKVAELPCYKSRDGDPCKIIVQV